MAYGTAEELARILGISPTAPQQEALTRVLEAGASEIDAYLGRASPLVEPYPPLAVEVNYLRAEEHWKSEQSPFGFVVLGPENMGRTGRNTWQRHMNVLLPLVERFGLA